MMRMETLSYKALEAQGYSGYLLRDAPEKVLQFGEGNFLRAFVDYWFDVSNEKAGWNGKCVLVQPIPQGLASPINRQEGLYTLYLRGRQNGKKVDRKRVISSVSRCLNPYEAEDYAAMMALAVSDDLEYVVSNTTEAGIVYDPACKPDDAPPASFPAKLTRLLWQRWYAGKPGLILLPCELIADNGTVLRDTVLRHAADWALEEDFLHWLREENRFCNTLVDRIVTGYPAAQAPRLNAENGYEDALLDTAEPFGLWVIEGDEALSREFPAQKAGLPVKFVADHHPYKEQKATTAWCWRPIWRATTSSGSVWRTRPSGRIWRGRCFRRSSPPYPCPVRTAKPLPVRWRSGSPTPTSITGCWISP